MKLEKNYIALQTKQKTTATTTKKFYKMMFDKHLSNVTMPSQIKPTRWIYVLQNLQGHFPVWQFLILDLNVHKDVNSL